MSFKWNRFCVNIFIFYTIQSLWKVPHAPHISHMKRTETKGKVNHQLRKFSCFDHSQHIVSHWWIRNAPAEQNLGLFDGNFVICMQVACLYFTEVHVKTWLTENNSWNCAGVMGLSLRRRLLNFLWGVNWSISIDILWAKYRKEGYKYFFDFVIVEVVIWPRISWFYTCLTSM